MWADHIPNYSFSSCNLCKQCIRGITRMCNVTRAVSIFVWFRKTSRLWHVFIPDIMNVKVLALWRVFEKFYKLRFEIHIIYQLEWADAEQSTIFLTHVSGGNPYQTWWKAVRCVCGWNMWTEVTSPLYGHFVHRIHHDRNALCWTDYV